MSDDVKLRSILATDCGSTTTKAILIELQGDEYRLVVRGEAPTTVEAPFEDVTRGVLNAIMEVEELCGRKILDGETILGPQEGDEGVDIYLSTSSAGGGLQMTVAGVVHEHDREERQDGRRWAPVPSSWTCSSPRTTSGGPTSGSSGSASCVRT
jgi:hypothetical protein